MEVERRRRRLGEGHEHGGARSQMDENLTCAGELRTDWSEAPGPKPDRHVGDREGSERQRFPAAKSGVVAERDEGQTGGGQRRVGRDLLAAKSHVEQVGAGQPCQRGRRHPGQPGSGVSKVVGREEDSGDRGNVDAVTGVAADQWPAHPAGEHVQRGQERHRRTPPDAHVEVAQPGRPGCAESQEGQRRRFNPAIDPGVERVPDRDDAGRRRHRPRHPPACLGEVRRCQDDGQPGGAVDEIVDVRREQTPAPACQQGEACDEQAGDGSPPGRQREVRDEARKGQGDGSEAEVGGELIAAQPAVEQVDGAHSEQEDGRRPGQPLPESAHLPGHDNRRDHDRQVLERLGFRQPASPGKSVGGGQRRQAHSPPATE